MRGRQECARLFSRAPGHIKKARELTRVVAAESFRNVPMHRIAGIPNLIAILEVSRHRRPAIELPDLEAQFVHQTPGQEIFEPVCAIHTRAVGGMRARGISREIRPLTGERLRNCHSRRTDTWQKTRTTTDATNPTD